MISFCLDLSVIGQLGIWPFGQVIRSDMYKKGRVHHRRAAGHRFAIATMSRGSDPTELPPAKSPRLLGPTTIDSLGEDILLDIFLRLPSLATLVRAALTCRSWRRAVASSPAFRRRFRELHRAPLLGLVAEPQRGALPAFAPAQHRDRDVLAAISGGDFSLAALLDPQGYAADVPLQWCIQDCRDGYLLLANRDAGLLAAVNPLARYSTEYIDMPLSFSSDKERTDVPFAVGWHLISSDEDPMWFQLVWLLYCTSMVQAVVFSSDTGDWFFHPWVDIKERALSDDADRHWLQSGVRSNDTLYWAFTNQEHMLKLDTATLEFSVSELPPYLKDQQGCRFVVGETKDGAVCMVFCIGLSIAVLMNRADDDGVETWPLSNVVNYEGDTNPPEDNDTLQAMAIVDGFVYLVTSEFVLSLCLETMKLEKLFPRSFRAHHFHPYIMAWPPSLVGNYGCFALIQDGVDNALLGAVYDFFQITSLHLSALFFYSSLYQIDPVNIILTNILKKYMHL